MSVAGADDCEPQDRDRAGPHNFGLVVPLPAPQGERRSRDSGEPPIIDLQAIREETPKRTPEAAPPSKDPAPKKDRSRLLGAASLTAILLVGAAAAAAHVQEWRTVRAETAETRLLARHVEAMSAKVDAQDAKNAHDEIASLRKTIADLKANGASAVAQLGQRVERIEKDPHTEKAGDREIASRLAEVAARLDKLEARTASAAVATHDSSQPMAQLAQRVDRMEKDEAARFDKLGDRLDHDASKAEILARIEKLEAKGVEAKTAEAKPASAASPAHITMIGKPEITKIEPGVSNESTGSVERPRPRLRGYYLAEIHNGFAMIDSPSGEFEVGPGDFVPGGGGRVLRIERQGRAWVVVTTQGQIDAMND